MPINKKRKMYAPIKPYSSAFFVASLANVARALRAQAHYLQTAALP